MRTTILNTFEYLWILTYINENLWVLMRTTIMLTIPRFNADPVKMANQKSTKTTKIYLLSNIWNWLAPAFAVQQEMQWACLINSHNQPAAVTHVCAQNLLTEYIIHAAGWREGGQKLLRALQHCKSFGENTQIIPYFFLKASFCTDWHWHWSCH